MWQPKKVESVLMSRLDVKAAGGNWNKDRLFIHVRANRNTMFMKLQMYILKWRNIITRFWRRLGVLAGLSQSLSYLIRFVGFARIKNKGTNYFANDNNKGCFNNHNPNIVILKVLKFVCYALFFLPLFCNKMQLVSRCLKLLRPSLNQFIHIIYISQ